MNYSISTIAAISTPPGKGGVAVIRISGDEALSVAKRVFTPRFPIDIKTSPRRQIYGDILYMGEPVDDGMLTYFPAPASYTGEDVVEISSHGGILITAKILSSVLASGARHAERGEFTRRAFVAGKISLSEAEAIGLLLDAKSDSQIRLASRASREKLSSEISEISSLITSILSSLFARIDYPEEDLGDFTDSECLSLITAAREKVSLLLSTYKTGHAVAEGIKTVIAGPPNAGKSTLYNLLVGKDAAIVTDIAGTTRDILEESITLGDCLLRLSDTAGIRDGGDTVEKIGIERAIERISEAELLLQLFPLGADISDSERRLLMRPRTGGCARIAIVTKCDGGENTERAAELIPLFDKVIEISALARPREAKEKITAAVTELFRNEKISLGNDAVISTARQNASLIAAKCALEAAELSAKSGLTQDIVASDVEAALGAVLEVDGRQVSEAIVTDIFARFCVGK